jgi:enamine deaminase RidA (YjgF/YER057c/UK114 family)
MVQDSLNSLDCLRNPFLADGRGLAGPIRIHWRRLCAGFNREPANHGGGQVSIERRIQELGLVLPKVPTPAANYANAVRMGNAIYLSGTVPARADGTIPKGKVGADVSTDEAVEHARLAALNILAIVRGELGSLDKARRVIKLLGMVNAVPDFREHSRVINGASDLFEKVFGTKHARSAIGVGSLPFGITVEVEVIVEVEPE